MNVIEILVYTFGPIFFFSALAFAYYAFRNARLMRGPQGHRLMAGGAVFCVLAVLVNAVAYFLLSGPGLILGFFVWVCGLVILIAGAVLRGRDIQNVYQVPLFRVLTMLPHTKLYLIAIAALLFINLPLLAISIFLFGIELSWFAVGTVVVWVFAFVLLAAAERKFHLSLKHLTTVSRVDMRRLRKDIRILKARLNLTNSYLLNLVMISGTRLLETILSGCVEENPVLLDGYKFEFLGRLRAEPFVKNLDRINSREKEQAIFKAFCSIDAGAVVSYARLTSPKQATVMGNRSFKDVVPHGETGEPGCSSC